MPAQKTKLSVKDIDKWLENHWNLYASKMHNGKLLRFWINGNKIFRVTSGNSILCEDFQIERAVGVWNVT